MTINYHDRGNDYRARKGVTIKTERYDYEPGKPEKTLRKAREGKNTLNVILTVSGTYAMVTA